jgi:hypothetical protein
MPTLVGVVAPVLTNLRIPDSFIAQINKIKYLPVLEVKWLDN